MLRLILLSILLLLHAPAWAERVVLGLSQDEVAITATFDGSSLLIFGAVMRDAPLPEGPPLDVIITVAGPQTPVEIHRKARRFGIWVNTDTVHISRAPSFYSVSSTGPLSQILSATEDLRHQISINRSLRTTGASDDASDVENFTDALKRLRQGEGKFQILEGAVSLDQQTLFRTSVDLPANLVEGDYPTRIFLLREGAVIDSYETLIDVRKVGLERWLYTLAHEQSLLYGLMSLVIAISAGWLASAVFRIFQR